MRVYLEILAALSIAVLALGVQLQQDKITKLRAEVQTVHRSTSCNCQSPTGSTLTNDVILTYDQPDDRTINQNAKLIGTNGLNESVFGEMSWRMSAPPTWYFTITNDETNGPAYASKQEGNRVTGSYRIDYSTNYAK